MKKDEIEILIETGEAESYPDGSVRYTAESDKRPGSIVKPPETAAKPFTSESGRLARQVRTYKHQMATARGKAAAVSQILGEPVTEAEAQEFLAADLTKKVVEATLRDPVKGMRYLDEAAGFEGPNEQTPKMAIQYNHFSFNSLDDAQDYLDQLEPYFPGWDSGPQGPMDRSQIASIAA